MKKYLAILCATMLCVCCLVLAACGGGSSSSSTASSSASTASSVKADPAEKFIGDWKLAMVESQGIKMSGDFSSILGSKEGMAISLQKDGAGSISLGSEQQAITWELKGDDAITIKNATASEGSTDTSLEAKYEDGTLQLDMQDEQITGVAVFTPTGEIDGVQVIDPEKATAITSKDELVGTWKLSGMNMAGLSVNGDSGSLAAMAGEDDTTLVFQDDGTCKTMGEDATWSITDAGTVIDSMGTQLPVLKLGDGIIVDMSGVMNVQLVMLFTK